MRGRWAPAAITVVAAIAALATPAHAGFVTYPAAEVPRTIDDGLTATSTITLPDGLPPATDVDVVGVRVSGAAGGSYADRYVELFRTSDTDRVFGLAYACTSAMDFDLTYDEQAGSRFTPPGDCTATATRALPLSQLLQHDEGTGRDYADGGWTVRLSDGGNPGLLAAPMTLQRWALRVGFEAMTFSAQAEKQKLRKRLEVEAKCSADCRVSAGGDAKNATFSLKALKTETLNVPLKKKARRRLVRRGKARIELGASNDLGDQPRETVAVALKRG